MRMMLQRMMTLWTTLLLTRMMYQMMWTVTTHTLMRGMFPRLQRRGMFRSHKMRRCQRGCLRRCLWQQLILSRLAFQLAVPAGKKPKTTVNSIPTAKIAKSQTYISVDRCVEELKVATTELKTKVKGMEFSESTTSSPMITAEPPEPNVTTDAAPSTEVTSEASKDLTTLTPTAAEENPAVDKSEVAKEEDKMSQ
jgi:hypothetical protein